VGQGPGTGAKSKKASGGAAAGGVPKPSGGEVGMKQKEQKQVRLKSSQLMKATHASHRCMCSPTSQHAVRSEEWLSM